MTEPCVILAGGRATRMGGGDKGLRVLRGTALLDLVLARLTDQAGPLALNANGDPARFAAWNLPVLADPIAGFVGPLGGVLAGMDWAADQGADHVLSVAADTPFFPRDLAARLREAAGPKGLSLAASPDETGRLRTHPTFGRWPVALRHDLRAALSDGLRKIVIWTDQHQAGLAPFASTPFDPFFNINTPEDIIAGETIMDMV